MALLVLVLWLFKIMFDPMVKIYELQLNGNSKTVDDDDGDDNNNWEEFTITSANACDRVKRRQKRWNDKRATMVHHINKYKLCVCDCCH